MQRRTLALVMSVAVLGGCAADPGNTAPTSSTAGIASSSVQAPATDDRLADQLETFAQGADAQVGVYGRDLDSGRTVEVSSDTRFPILSMFKVYAAAAILDAAAHGRLALTDAVRIDASDVVANSPITSQQIGRSMTYDEIARAALQHSDNTAGNLMLRALGGPSAITAMARSVGDTATDLVRREVELNTAIPGDNRDTTTPKQFATGLGELLVGQRLTPTDRATLVTWMRGSVTSATRFRAHLPVGWTTADKTGAGDYGSTNDGGILFGPSGRRILLVVQTRDAGNRQDATALGGLIADIASAVVASLREGQALVNDSIVFWTSQNARSATSLPSESAR